MAQEGGEVGYLMGLRFYTNLGVISPLFGQFQPGTRTVMEYIPNGFRIIGFYMEWREGLALKFYYAKSVLPTY